MTEDVVSFNCVSKLILFFDKTSNVHIPHSHNSPLSWKCSHLTSLSSQDNITLMAIALLIMYYALSFYGSKMILDSPNHFGQVPIVLVGSNLFWSDPNHFGQVQIIKISPKKSNLNLTKVIWTRPKRYGPDQNNLYPSKTIWTVQNKDKA